MLEPLWLPPPLWPGMDADCPPLRPPEEEDCEPPLDPPPEGMLDGIDELRPPPEEPPPDGEGIPDDGEEGIDEEEDC